MAIQLVGQMAGAIRDLEVESDESSSEEEEERPAQAAQKKSGGMFSIFKGKNYNKKYFINRSLKIVRNIQRKSPKMLEIYFNSMMFKPRLLTA